MNLRLFDRIRPKPWLRKPFRSSRTAFSRRIAFCRSLLGVELLVLLDHTLTESATASLLWASVRTDFAAFSEFCEMDSRAFFWVSPRS